MAILRNRKNTEGRTIDVISIIICALVFFVSTYPIYYCLINSLNDGQDAARGGIYLFPRVWSLENYAMVLKEPTLLHSFFLTVARTVLGALMHIGFTSMIAYGMSRKELMFRRFYSIMGVVTMYVGGGIIPTYLLYFQLKLTNTFWVYVLPGMFSFYNMILMMSFFRQLPQALVESARIDGASHFKTYVRIMLPLSGPIIATVALFVGVSYWNDWFAPAYYVTDERLMTIPATLMRLMSLTDAQAKLSRMYGQMAIRPTVTMESMRYATLIVSIAPIVILYPFLQKYFVQGMMIGSIKE